MISQEALDYLVCPLCGSGLELKDGTLQDGTLEDHLGHRFPVRNAVARLLPSQVLQDGAPPTKNGQDAGTVSSFGFEWNRFDLKYSREKWDRIVSEVVGVRPEYFDGKVVVDAGCGAGLHARYLTERGARHVLAMDLSDAVERAQANTSGNDRVTVIQGDLLAPPIKPGSVDFVLCVGVIQHTQDPERVLRSLMALLRPGGELGVTFYTRREGFSPFLFLRKPLRTLLSRLPAAWLFRLTWLLAQASRLPILGPLLLKTILIGDADDRDWKTTWLCTYDWYGSHTFHRIMRPSEVWALFERMGWTDRVTDVRYRGLPGCYRLRAV